MAVVPSREEIALTVTAAPATRLWQQLNGARWNADDLLLRFGVSGPPVDVLRLARELGAEVRFVKGADWDGALESSEYGDATIYVCTTGQSRERQRFTLAHELGHLLRHPPGRVFRDDLSTRGTDPAEVQANAFAADLLMPRWMLEPLIASGRRDIEDLARLFEVSPRAMEVRLQNLGYRVG